MIYLPLNPFNPVANGARATVAIPRYDMSLARIVLNFPGTNSITKSTISEIVLKIGARVVFGPISGAELDALNKYRGLQDRADTLTIDLTERDGLSVIAKELGAIDIPALGGQDIFLEVMNSASSGTPALTALAGYTSLQFDPSKPTPDGQFIKKILAYNIPTTGGTQITWTPNFKGAQVQRVHFKFAGTNFSGSTDGNLKRIEVKKNGVAVHDVMDNLNRFLLQEQMKTPQAQFYHLDFVADNVHSAALATADARALEFNLTLTAADTVKAIVEVLDVPNNL